MAENKDSIEAHANQILLNGQSATPNLSEFTPENDSGRSPDLTVLWDKAKESIITPCKQLLLQENPPWEVKGNMEAMEAALNSGTFVEIMDIRKYLTQKDKTARFNGEVYIVLLDNGIKAVFKPREGDAIAASYAEISAYQASKWLAQHTGRHLVPPTVLKTHRGRTGSLQWFVESKFDLWIEKDRTRAFAALSKDDIANGACFTHVFGQWDAHPGNHLISQDKMGQTILAMIDNEGIGNRQHSTDIKNRPFVRIAYAEVPEGDPIIKNLSSTPKDELRNLWSTFKIKEKTVQFLSTLDVDYMIWENGLWIRYHQNNPNAFPNYTDHYPKWLIEAYQQLNEVSIRQIFDDAIKAVPQRFNEWFLSDVLLRSKQMLNYIRDHIATPLDAAAEVGASGGCSIM